ncbi:MAG: type VI secretion system protein TssA [Planctomycetia bacterium]|nr:type VI secretion system protein TssA [Planctomycetia bacterium]
MPSPAVLDFAKLLAPLPGDGPAGIDLRTDASPESLYFAIKGARNAARAAERQAAMADEESKPPPPDWKPVLQNSIKAIGEKSKDLEITAFLTEALVRQHGYAGLRDGFRLARELVEKFWDVLYPRPDEDGLETRLGGLVGLNGDDAEGTLIAPIARVPITEKTSVGQLTAANYLEAVAVGKIADPKAKQRKIDQGTPTLDTFQKAVSETSNAFYATLVQDLAEAQQEFAKLCATLDPKCGPQAPPSSNIRSALEAALEAINAVAKAKIDAAAAATAPKPEAAAPAAKPGAPAAGAAPAESADVIRTREDAFKVLQKVADFFKRTEPHTVIAFTIEQVVRWGRMPLPELLAELIPEEAARKNLFKQVGIRAEPGKPEAKK